MPLRDRIQAWEVTPPPGSWEKIAAALSEDRPAAAGHGDEPESSLRDRMTAYEATPPAGAWQAIAASLGKTTGEDHRYPRAKVVPQHSLRPYLYRYAGVAAIVALVVWGLNSNFFDPQKQNISTSIVRVPAPGGKQNAGIAPAAPDQRNLPHALPRPTATLAASFPYSLPPVTALRQLPATTPDARYFRISNEKGYPVRLSAKFAPLYYQLLSDLETKSGSTRLLLEALQQQAQQATFGPDPANLLDMARIQELLVENETY
ncbi:MAG: hypothetical protein QM664_02410 [Flavihumibacter sp.]